MGVEIVGLGAWCDYETVDEYRDRMAGSARPSDPVAPGEPAVPGVCRPDRATLDAFARQLNFRVEEFARLSDGRRLTLTDDRGWSISGPGSTADDLWVYQTVESIHADVLNVLLPDDAEQTGDEHPWASLAAHLRAHGVEATPEDLRRLPYDVILSPRLRARLSGTARRP